MSFTLNRPLYTDKDKKLVLEEGDPKAAFLIGGKGTPIDDADAEKYGLDDSHRQAEADGAEEAFSEDAQAKTRKVSGSAEPSPEKPEGKGAGDKASESPDSLDSHTVAELKEIAAKEDVDLAGVTLKADIIAAIQLHRESNGAK